MSEWVYILLREKGTLYSFLFICFSFITSVQLQFDSEIDISLFEIVVFKWYFLPIELTFCYSLHFLLLQRNQKENDFQGQDNVYRVYLYKKEKLSGADHDVIYRLTIKLSCQSSSPIPKVLVYKFIYLFKYIL